MENRRYQIGLFPLLGFNGKLAPSSVRCRNVQNEGEEVDCFQYGFRRGKKDRVFYGFRCRPRVLSRNPYTDTERASHAAFGASIALASRIMVADAGDYYHARRSALAEFAKDRLGKYYRFYNFLIAQIKKNGGRVPDRWLRL